MKAADVCRMREAFLEECKRQDYVIPSTASRTPVLQNLSEDDVIDKSTVATLSSAIRESLNTTDQRISQLCQQLKGQLFTKGFLIRVLAVLCSDSVDVTETHIADLGRQVGEINKALLAVAASETFQFCSSGREIKTSSSKEQPAVIKSDSHVRNKFDSFSCVGGRAKPVAAARSRSRAKCESSHVISDRVGEIDSVIARPRPKSEVNVTELNKTRRDTPTVASFHSHSDNLLPSVIADPCFSPEYNTDLCPGSQHSRGISDECGNTQMKDDAEDEESPYDNVITLQEYLTMFRRKKSNASKADLERSNTLTCKDNFLAVTSKHVAPSNIPRSQESTTQSPHLGRHFQMLKMTAGFDFVLDDNASDVQTQANGSGREASQLNNDSSKANSNVVVDSRVSEGGVSTAINPNIDNAINSLSSDDDSERDVDVTGHTSLSALPQGVSNSNQGSDKRNERETSSDKQESCAEAQTVSTSRPGNETFKTDSSRLTPSAPPACEILAPTAQSETNAHTDTSPGVSTTLPAASGTSPVVHRAETSEDKRTARPPDGVGVVAVSTPSSPTTRGNMDSAPKPPPVSLRNVTKPRVGVTSVPPPVAKKPARIASGKTPPPTPGVKPALKPSQSAHSHLSSNSNVSDHTVPPKPGRVGENSTDNNKDDRSCSPRPSESSSLILPSLSKSPMTAGNASKPVSAFGDRKESVKGIAKLIDGRNHPHPVQVSTPNVSDAVSKTNRNHRDYTPSPPVPARKRPSGVVNLEEDTHSEQATSRLPGTAKVGEEETSSNPNKTHSHSDGKCDSEENSEEDRKPSVIETAVRHSLVAADAVPWPSGLEHPELQSFSGDEDRENGKGGGIGELVEQTHSSLISIHGRLKHSDTLETDTEPVGEAVSSKLESRVSNSQDYSRSEEGSKTLEDVNPAARVKLSSDGHNRELPFGVSTASRMWSQDSEDTIVNSEEGSQDNKSLLDRSISFTSDQEVKEAILSLDAMIKSEPMDDPLERIPSLRLSTASTASSAASGPRCSSSPSSPVSLRRQHELGVSDVSASRRKSSTASYENWTINRAVTRLITSTPDFDSSEEDEEEDDGLSEGVASPCLMKRNGPAKGSKDSGLSVCDDVSLTSESGHVATPATVSGTEGLVGDLADGKIRDLKALKLMTECAEDDEEDIEGGEDLDAQKRLLRYPQNEDQDMDSISVASDILFIPGSRGGSRIRKYAAAHEQLLEEDEEQEVVEPPGAVDEDGGSGESHQQHNYHHHQHQQHHHLQQHHHHQQHYEEREHLRLSSSSSPECQRPGISEHKARLSREMSDSISVASSCEDEEQHSITMDSSYDETDSAREGMLKMRQLLVKGVLDSEKVYLDILTVLINYKKLLETNSASTQPVISREDVSAIFSNIETIYRIHSEFVTSLEPKVKDWHHEESIGEIFKIMISKFIDFGNYLTNYQQAVSTIHRCSQGNERFQELAQKIVVTSTVKEVSSLEDALFKPVQRVQRNTLVLHDLIKYTPQDHPDHEALQKALKLSHHILETFATAVPNSATSQENRRLVKSSFLVELVNGVRKLRYVFLFSDVLVCTKRETHRNNKVTFEPKWFTPLSQATFDTKFDYTDDTKHTKREDIDQLKSKLRALKKEMRAEMKKFDDKDKHRSLVSLGGATRVVEKLRKKISQYEAQLILASPRLPFKVSLDGGKVYTLLMTTDYEREEWKETIRSLCSRTAQQAPVMSSIFVQDLINSVKETPQVNKIGSVLLQKDEDILSGTLNVTIHKMNGLTEDCDTYCCLEMDSFGHFFMKARTHICEGTRDPAWNEDFELELESSQTLRFLCFKRGETGNETGDTMLGRGALELSKQWLKGSFQEKTVSMNEISLVVSVKHTPAEKTMQRVPSRVSAAVFGVKITSLARREGKTVPTIVTACLQEVEKRGLDELGIYRVSGVTSELQRIKKLFDKNIRSGAACLSDVDINAVTGILKLYFRELPEPLFTEACYQNFIDTLKLQDEEAKAQCMLSLLHGLPDTNYYTIVTLMEHLIKVARNVGENKMSIHNLSTIFGPTLLAPAANQTASDPLEMMCKGAEQVLRQSGVVNYLLGLAVSGRSLRRSA